MTEGKAGSFVALAAELDFGWDPLAELSIHISRADLRLSLLKGAVECGIQITCPRFTAGFLACLSSGPISMPFRPTATIRNLDPRELVIG